MNISITEFNKLIDEQNIKINAINNDNDRYKKINDDLNLKVKNLNIEINDNQKNIDDLISKNNDQ